MLPPEFDRKRMMLAMFMRQRGAVASTPDKSLYDKYLVFIQEQELMRGRLERYQYNDFVSIYAEVAKEVVNG
ncbi:MAG: hypothetical protein HUJ61_05070 [Bacilli bacterium]|nr:hypothetical protein [Bacilli bacterium]